MIKSQHPTWQPLEKGKRERGYWPDSCCAIVTNTGYDLTLPSGRHVRGSADSLDIAKLKAVIAHNEYVCSRWAHGRMASSGEYLVPLK